MFFEYLGAIVNYWFTLLLGAFGSLPWWLRPLFPPKIKAWFDKHPKPVKWLGIMSIIISFVWANFLAWNDEHLKWEGKRQETEKLSVQLEKEKENNRPNIIIEQQQFLLITGDIQGKPPSLFLNLVVKNIGAPSVVIGWRLNIKFPDNSSLLIKPRMIGQVTLMDKNKKGKEALIAKFHQDNELVEKTAVAIQRGSFKAGWLWFELPNVTKEKLKLCIITLSVEDIVGKEYFMKVDISKSDNTYRDTYIPGSGENIFKPSTPLKD